MIILTSNQIQLEQEILGAMFQNNSLILKAIDTIKPEMFLYSKHINIYVGMINMVSEKMAVDLITFLEQHKKNIGDMDGVAYITEIFSCSPSELGFITKLEILVKNYKKNLYMKLGRSINDDMSLEEIESEIESVKVKIHKCVVKKELDIEQQFQQYSKWLHDKNRDCGIKSGFIHVDKYLGNFQKGRLITVFARSGVGKTTFSLQIAANMALQGYKVFYGSAEMTRNQVFNKMAASALSLSSSAIDEDSISELQKESIMKFMDKISEKKFYISTETNFSKFINEIKLYKMQNTVDVVFVDYINKYIDYNGNELMTNRLGKISGILKTLAMEENICIVLLAQANRAVDKKVGDCAIEKMEPSDIQDSARIEQDSDQIIALYRNIRLDDKLYRERMFKQGKLKYKSKDAEENPECINILVIKNRHGNRGTCAANWQGRYSRVCDF